mmetsp:Transcript_48222/g.148859  ORF Transcript_48222/g.148859 Transcript_48222/m.148859 type:complete len:526 (+) Transcript_48222:84-1661(+)
MARFPRALYLALLHWPMRAVSLRRQIPDSVLDRYKALHKDVYGPDRKGKPLPMSIQRMGDKEPGQPAGPAHYWPHARGHVRRYSLSNYRGPRNLTRAMKWSWHHPEGRYHTVVVGAPLLDVHRNIYLTTEDGIRKFSPNGEVLWHYQGASNMVGSSSLWGNAIFGNTVDGHTFSLDLTSGKELWSKKYAQETGLDPAFVEVHQGVVVAGVDGGKEGGNKRIVGVDSASGVLMWQFTVKTSIFDFMPVFPDDDTTVFQDSSGGVYRLGLSNGTLLWYTQPETTGKTKPFARGGLTLGLGVDGGVFSCANKKGKGEAGSLGALRKFRLRDGRLEWERELPYPCNTWPVYSPDDNSVVVPIGARPNVPTTYNFFGSGKQFLTQLHRDNVLAGNTSRSLLGYPALPGAIMAFDAKSGSLQWREEVDPWGAMAAAGDEEGILERKELKNRAMCMPSHWSAPTVDSMGNIFVGRLDGFLYEFRHGGGVVKFYTGSGAGPPGVSFAEGMMAYADCDSLYVFDTPKAKRPSSG